jgi:hypothetical protein
VVKEVEVEPVKRMLHRRGRIVDRQDELHVPVFKEKGTLIIFFLIYILIIQMFYIILYLLFNQLLFINKKIIYPHLDALRRGHARFQCQLRAESGVDRRASTFEEKKTKIIEYMP